MREFEVVFTAKASGTGGHPERVVAEIGGQNWRLKREAAIAWLNSDAHTFYVKAGEEKTYLVVASHNGQSWLRSIDDWSKPNELLNLPDFPPGHGK